MHIRTSAPVASILLLAACSGDGGGADLLIARAPTVFETFETIRDSEGVTDYDNVANESGSVVYNGVATFEAGTRGENGNEIADFVAIGSFTATADFGAAQAVTATASDFFELSDPQVFENENTDFDDVRVAGPIDGQFDLDLEISEFFFDASVQGTVTGSLTRLNGSVESFNGPSALGDFYGDEFDVLDVSADRFLSSQYARLEATGLR